MMIFPPLRLRFVLLILAVTLVNGFVSERPIYAQAICDESVQVARPQYTVDAEINFPARTADVRQTVVYRHRGDEPLEDLLLNVEPNRWFDVFTLNRVDAPGGPPDYVLENKRLLVTLDEPLLPGCETWLVLDYRLNVPQIGTGVYTTKGYFGHSPRQMNLGHWLATVAVRQNATWITHEPVLIGEQEVLEQADWDVTLTLTGVNAESAPLIAAPGTAARLAGTTWRYTLEAARDFSLSLSDSYRVNTIDLEDGTTVELYSFENAWSHVDDDGVSAPEHALDMAATSLAMFADLFGPYPYERFSVVQGDFPDGMEFAGLVFVGGGWFTNWNGTPAGYLTLITVHEVAHQWWYNRVGNDAALTPWLDEALATYSEYIFLEEYYADLRDWWWGFRVDSYYPEGFVDGTVYEFDTARSYINAVYLRGVQMLHAMREDLGTDAFFQLLADYAAAGDGRIADPDLFWSLLTPEQLAATESTRIAYLREPRVLTGTGETNEP